MRMFLSIRIALILVDRSADIVLPLIDLLMLLSGQVATISRAIVCNLAIDARLATLNIARLDRRHLARTNALRNALLLILSPHSRPGKSRILRMSAIYRSKVAAIGMRHLHVVALFRSSVKMTLMLKRHLTLGGTHLDPANSA